MRVFIASFEIEKVRRSKKDYSAMEREAKK
jgi:hypothetical protein